MVLWTLIETLAAEESLKAAHFYVYTDCASAHDAAGILRNARSTFGLRLPDERVHFVFLGTSWFLDAVHYPRFTMILQSLGSLVPALHALLILNPQVIIDTAGYPFTYPVFRLVGGCRVMCYTHYPTISADMVQRVVERASGFNHASPVARSTLLTNVKLIYYRVFASLYRLMGRVPELVLANSHWTQEQLVAMWPLPADRVVVVFPPCPTTQLAALPIQPREALVLSLGQFRPEKNHALQIAAFRLALASYTGKLQPRMMLVGTVRAADQPRIEALQLLVRGDAASHIADLSGSIQFAFDLPRAELNQLMGRALIGLHTMRAEHFGIGVVELMASGLVAVAHKSGGPLMDIVVPSLGRDRCGYLAETVEEYATSIVEIINAYEREPSSVLAIQQRGRQRAVEKFSSGCFQAQVRKHLLPLLLSCSTAADKKSI